MGRKTVIETYKLVSSQSMGASITSSAVVCKNVDRLIFVCEASGTPTGTLSAQVLLSDTSGTQSDSSWVTLDFGTAPAFTGSADTHTLHITNTGFSQIRIVYTRSSGTGTLDVRVRGFVIGA